MNKVLAMWAICQTDNFSLNDDQLIFPEDGVETFTDELLQLPVWEKVWEPLLAQSAIEGINREYVKQDDGWALLQSEKAIVLYVCYHQEEVFTYEKYTSETAAKIAALEYIYKIESK